MGSDPIRRDAAGRASDRLWAVRARGSDRGLWAPMCTHVSRVTWTRAAWAFRWRCTSRWLTH